MPQEDITTKYKLDISEFQKNIKAANQSIKMSNAQFKAATAGMDDWSRTSEGLEAKLKQLNGIVESQKAKLKAYQSQLNEAEKAQRENGRRAEEMRAKYQQAAKQYGENSKEAKQYKTSLNQMEKEQDKAGQKADQLRIQILNQSAAVARTEKDIRNYKTKLSELEQELGNTGQAAQESGKKMESIRGGITTVKAAMANLAAEGVKALIEGLKGIATEGENAMDKFQASTGTGAGAMKEFKNEILELYKGNYGESIEEVATAMANVKQQTKETDPSKLKEMTKYALTMSDTFDMDLGESIRGINQLMQQYDITAREAFDLYAKGSQNGLNYTDELGDNIAEYAGKFKQAGYGAAEYFQLLQNGTKSGAYNLDKVNDAINEVTTRLADGTIADNLKIYSTQTQDLFKKWQKGGATQKEVIDSIVKDINNCTNEQEALNMASQAFGTMGEDFNIDFIKSLTSVGDAYKNVKGTMEELDQVRYDNTQSQLASIGRTVRTELVQPFAEAALPILADFLGWFTKNIPTILALLASLGAGFAVFKIGTTIASLTTELTTFATVLNGLRIVLMTNPVGWLTLLAGAVAGIAVYTATTKKATSATDKQVAATEREIKKHKELSKTIKENEKNRKNNLESSKTEGVQADFLYKRLEKLVGAEKKTSAQKAQIKSIVEQLNSIMPDLNLKYDEEKDKLNKSTEAIKGNIAAQKELMLAKAAQENMEGIAKDIASKEIEQTNLIKAQTKAKQEYKKADKEAKEAEEAWAKTGYNQYSEEAVQYNKKIRAAGELKKSWDDAKQAVKENKEELKKLNTQYDNMDKYAQQKIESSQIEQQLSAITEKMKAKGKKVPEAVAQGIREGQYTVPTTISGMENLIKFDSAAKKAKLDGVKIPSNLAKGISSGKISAKAAVKALEKVAEFDESSIVKKAQKAGVKIPDELREGIASGKLSIKKATKILTKTMDDELGKEPSKAKKKGEKSGSAHAKGVKSKKGENKKAGKGILDSVVQGASNEAQKMGKAGEKGADKYNAGIRKKKKTSNKEGKNLGKESKSGAESIKTETSGKNFGQGFVNGIGSKLKSAFDKAVELAKHALSGLKKGQKEGSPSKITTQSGKYFGEGYKNGIVSMFKAVGTAGKQTAGEAYKALKKEQQEHSPSKLTYKSGRNFVHGYIKGIVSLKNEVAKTAKSLVDNVINEMRKLENYNFSKIAENAGKAFSEEIEGKISLTYEKMTYQNEKKVAYFDSTINSLEKKKANAEKTLKSNSSLAKKIDKLEAKKKKAKSKKEKKVIQKQIDKYEKELNNKVKKSNTQYNKWIAQQQAFKEAYQTASEKMLSEYQTAMNEYQTKAEELISSTINGITDTYQAKYDELINKQDTLIQKLQSAGELFEVSSAGVMTVNDINEQTKSIREYAGKLQQMKNSVSEELFEQITSYDMQQGNAFMDRLLSMSKEELKAYDDAYKEKMRVSKELAENLYKNDFSNLSNDYQKAISEAFKSIPAKLEEIGRQCIEGFIEGFNENTEYMDKNIKTMATAILDEFKNQLGIHSPSVKFEWMGIQSGLGYVNGFIEKMKKLRKDMLLAVPMQQLGEMTGKIPIQIQKAGENTGNTKIVKQNFIQNISSPKPVNHLEVYRQTHNILNYAKA